MQNKPTLDEQMRGLRHILIMMILCPWIGGTIIGYSAYLTTKVTDLPSGLSYLFTAAVGVLLFGLLLTCVAHVLFTSVSYGAFLLIHHTKAATHQKFWWICGLSFAFAILEGLVVLPIARDIKAPDSSVIVACMVAGSVGAWLNSLNWLPPNESRHPTRHARRPVITSPVESALDPPVPPHHRSANK